MKKLIGACSVLVLVGLVLVGRSFADQAPPPPTPPAPTNAPSASVNFVLSNNSGLTSQK